MKKAIKRIVIVICISFTLMLVTLMKVRDKPFNQEYVESVIEEAQSLYNIPAISIQVFDSEKINYQAINGVRVFQTMEFVTSEDYFHIGSCSKSILAMIAAKQVERGHIQWSTPFFDVFPELRAEANTAYVDITLEDLLSCQAGIMPYTSGEEVYPNLSDSQDPQIDFIRFLIRQDPLIGRRADGKFEFQYSNASYAMAAAMLESVTDLSYDRLLEEFIEIPLELDIWIGWPYEKNENQPYGHFVSQDKTLLIAEPDIDYKLNDLIIPAGNLSMKPDDFGKFTMMHLKGLVGKSDYLAQEYFEKINIGEKSNKTSTGENFAMGAYSGDMLGYSYVSFDGTAGTFYARGVILPEEDFGFTILYNNGSAQAVEYITLKLVKAKYNWWWMFWI